MRGLLTALLALPAVACLQLTSSDDGGAGVIGSNPGPATGGGPAVEAGTNCTEPSGGVELCEQIAACPGVDVDPGALPNCGFRLGSAASIDLECDCSGLLCPIGVPETCANAAALLQGQSSFTICEQASLGLCLSTGGSTSDGGNSGAASGCDPVCESECAGSPGCIQLCGC
jgi:hypothetical protein